MAYEDKAFELTPTNRPRMEAIGRPIALPWLERFQGTFVGRMLGRGIQFEAAPAPNIVYGFGDEAEAAVNRPGLLEGAQNAEEVVDRLIRARNLVGILASHGLTTTISEFDLGRPGSRGTQRLRVRVQDHRSPAYEEGCVITGEKRATKRALGLNVEPTRPFDNPRQNVTLGYLTDPHGFIGHRALRSLQRAMGNIVDFEKVRDVQPYL